MEREQSRAVAGMAEINGTRLYYEVRGSGLPIVFVHGFTLDRRMWRAQAEALAEQHQVVTYDARGFGRSDVPDAAPYRHCDDIAALCEHLGLSQVVLVGHSIGGHHTLECALERPDLIAGWVPLCMSGLGGIPFPEEVTQMFSAIRRAARESGLDEAKRIWRRAGWFATALESPRLAEEIDAILADYTGWHWTHENPARNIDPPASERLSELRMPVLVITGKRDLPYNDRIGAVLREKIPHALALELPGAGHMPSMEAPDAVNRALADFAATL
jgi:pimeloyl-ACP methyl ester carboxylesterase